MNITAYRDALQRLIERADTWRDDPPLRDLDDACSQFEGLKHLIIEHRAELARNKPLPETSGVV